MTYVVSRLFDLLEETDPDGGGVPNRVLEPGPLPSLIDVHVVLEAAFQERLEERSHLPLMVPPQEVPPMTFGGDDGVGEEEIPEDVIPQRIGPRPNKDVLRLGVGAASASTSPAELRPIERPLEGLEVGLDLPSSERVVGDGVGIIADPAGGGDGGGDGVAAGWHDDD